jgi:hypothetical protein
MRYKNGTEVEVTIRGTVLNDGGGKGSRDFHSGAQRVVDEGGLDHWVNFTPPGHDAGVDVEVIKTPAPDAEAGSVWQTDAGVYFARISRRDLPLRMTPYDQSEESGLKTLPIEAFFEKYPEALCSYSPSLTGVVDQLDSRTLEYGDVRSQAQPGFTVANL